MRYTDYYTEHNCIQISNGKSAKILELTVPDDDTVLNEWARHLRMHYAGDQEIEFLRQGYGYTREEYLLNIKFPSASGGLGPATRSGDFTEILIADYMEFIEEYFVPRTRYDRKITRNSSAQGSDLIAFKMGEVQSRTDELVICEVKAQVSESNPANRLQDAIIDSQKDVKRLAESLNAINQRYIDRGEFESATVIQRFQNATDWPYKLSYGAAAVHSTYSYDPSMIARCSTENHTDPDVKLIVVYSEQLMKKIHELYGRASQC